MSRVIDLTKPLKELSEDDLRYAHDRSLLSLEDTERVGEWLRKKDAERASGKAKPAAAEPESDTETVVYDPTEHSVDDVLEYLKSLDTDTGDGEDEYNRVIQAERDRSDGKDPRKGIVGE